MDPLEQRVSQLEAELQAANSFLEEKDRDLVMAAEFGKKLLETNQDLQNRSDQITKEYAERIEALEQEKYSLQLKLDCQRSNAEAIHQELETMKEHLEQEHAMKVQRLGQVCSKKTHELSSLNEDLKSEVEKLEVRARSQQEKIKRQEETIEQLNEDISGRCNTTILQHELRDLEQMCAEEKARAEELEMRLLDSEAMVEMLRVEASSLAHKVEGLEEECEERSSQANTWYEALKEAKDQNAELTVQLEMMKVEMMGDNFHNRGNSLFGEVEDRRMDSERKLITLQVKNESLEKSHSTTRQQLKKLKAEMSALLCQYGATTADAAHVQRLQRALQQSRSENQALLTKLQRMERQQADVASTQEKQKCMAAFVDLGDKREYIQLLEQELQQAHGEKSSVLRELDMKRTQLLWETQKLSDVEARLHHSQQEQAKSRRELTKLRMRLQETLEKLAQATTSCKQLEGEKNLLEEQLKTQNSRRQGRRSQANSRRSSVQNPNQTLHGNDKSLTASENLPPTSNQGPEVQSSSSTVDAHSAPSTISQPKRPINILEDLDKEFNKQQLERDQSSLPPGWDPKRAPASTSLLKISSDVAVTSESEPRDARKLASVAPSRVVHINSKENVNQCPQQ